jgi:hypothetical protein
MGVLSGAKAEPTDPIRGFLNDVIDVVGFPRPEDALGTPADIVHQAGLPTVRDAVPMPAEAFARLTRGLRQGGAGFPQFPTPKMLFPFTAATGEASRGADVGESEVADVPVGTMAQRYYQKPPFP